jgi:hypothetical protein
VANNGPFAFETRLEDDASFVVSVVGEAPCLLEGESGVVMGADAQVMVTCEGVLLLQNLAISGPTAPDLGFVPGTFVYGAEVSLLQEFTRVTATAMSAESSITIAGMPAESGVPGPELPLALGDNAIAVTVTHPRGGERTYHITVSRAAELAQYAYGKASNTGAGDYFGWSVALSGDTLAIAAYGEASASTGVGGNQDDYSAERSGAIYIFH